MFTKLEEYILNENIKKCLDISITPEIENEVKKFKTSEKLLRSGGISTKALDRAAFGFSSDDITSLLPKQLKIKWKDDLENVKYEIDKLFVKSGAKNKTNFIINWSKNIDLTTPIEVSYEKNNFYIEDGHHRYFAAKILNKPLNVNIEIKMNPITKLTPSLSYDDFHRCIFDKVNNTLN